MPAAQLLLLLALSPLADPVEDDAQTLQAIRIAVREQFTSIKSLELQFHEYDPERMVHLANWELRIDGSKFLMASSGKQFATGPDSRIWDSFDGKMFYFIDYDPADLTRVRSIYRSPSMPRNSFDYALPLKLFGWKLTASDATFLDMLDRPAVRLLAKEDVEGHSCWKVDLGMITYKGNPTNRLTAWFDPAVGYWMRRRSSMPQIVPREDGQPVRLADGQLPYDYVATEFDQLDDMATGVQRWFPTRYTILGIQRTLDLILEEIKINPSIPEGRFTPDIPTGTLIRGGPGTLAYILQDPVDERELETRRVEHLVSAAARSKAAAAKSIFGAMASEQSEWTAILWKLLLVVTAVCSGFWWLGRKRATR